MFRDRPASSAAVRSAFSTVAPLATLTLPSYQALPLLGWMVTTTEIQLFPLPPVEPPPVEPPSEDRMPEPVAAPGWGWGCYGFSGLSGSVEDTGAVDSV